MVGTRRLKLVETGATRVSARAENEVRLAARSGAGKMTLSRAGGMNSGVHLRQARPFRPKPWVKSAKNDPVQGWGCAWSLNLRIQVKLLMCYSHIFQFVF